ncbi:Uncharacterised protein [Klebsiella michiganensis]|nr:Uncharacterised protein [Klebsiella michiganensis]
MMRDTKTLDLFSDLLTNHMRAQQFAGFGVENSLYKTSVSRWPAPYHSPDMRTYRS